MGVPSLLSTFPIGVNLSKEYFSNKDFLVHGFYRSKTDNVPINQGKLHINTIHADNIVLDRPFAWEKNL